VTFLPERVAQETEFISTVTFWSRTAVHDFKGETAQTRSSNEAGVSVSSRSTSFYRVVVTKVSEKDKAQQLPLTRTS
jgi:hypothetical protein